MPASVVARTKGLAAAPVFDLFAVKRSFSPRTKTAQARTQCAMSEGRTHSAVTRHDHSYDKDSANIEDQNPDECPPNSSRDVLAWVLSFADCHTDELRPDEGEKSIDKRAPKTEEYR